MYTVYICTIISYYSMFTCHVILQTSRVSASGYATIIPRARIGMRIKRSSSLSNWAMEVCGARPCIVCSRICCCCMFC